MALLDCETALRSWWFYNGFKADELQLLAQKYNIKKLIQLKILPLDNLEFMQSLCYDVGILINPIVSPVYISYRPTELGLKIKDLINRTGDIPITNDITSKNKMDNTPSILSIPFHFNIYKDVGTYILSNLTNHKKSFCGFDKATIISPHDLKSDIYGSSKCYQLIKFYKIPSYVIDNQNTYSFYSYNQDLINEHQISDKMSLYFIGQHVNIQFEKIKQLQYISRGWPTEHNFAMLHLFTFKLYHEYYIQNIFNLVLSTKNLKVQTDVLYLIINQYLFHDLSYLNNNSLINQRKWFLCWFYQIRYLSKEWIEWIQNNNYCWNILFKNSNIIKWFLNKQISLKDVENLYEDHYHDNKFKQFIETICDATLEKKEKEIEEKEKEEKEEKEKENISINIEQLKRTTLDEMYHTYLLSDINKK